MAGQVFPGRFTAETDKPVVVFLIGMRVNRLLAVRKWLPTFLAMGPMLRELYTHPEKGFLGAETFVSWRTVLLVQYWRSFDDLDHFARNANDPHLKAWQQYNKRVGYAQGTVGVYHETYVVPAGQMETIYNNMPVFGLAAATAHAPITHGRATARRRLGGENEPAVPVPDQVTQ